jgi:hypothetical protein
MGLRKAVEERWPLSMCNRNCLDNVNRSDNFGDAAVDSVTVDVLGTCPAGGHLAEFQSYSCKESM